MLQYYQEPDENSLIPFECILLTSHGEVRAYAIDSMDVPFIPEGSRFLFVEDRHYAVFIFTYDWSDEVEQILQIALSNLNPKIGVIEGQHDGYTKIYLDGKHLMVDCITFEYTIITNIH